MKLQVADKQLIDTTGVAGWQAVKFALSGERAVKDVQVYQPAGLHFILNC